MSLDKDVDNPQQTHVVPENKSERVLGPITVMSQEVYAHVQTFQDVERWPMRLGKGVFEVREDGGGVWVNAYCNTWENGG